MPVARDVASKPGHRTGRSTPTADRDEVDPHPQTHRHTFAQAPSAGTLAHTVAQVHQRTGSCMKRRRGIQQADRRTSEYSTGLER